MKAIRLIGLVCAALAMVLAMAPATALAADHAITTDGTVQLNTLGLASGDTLTIGAGRTVTLVGDGTSYVDLRIVCGAGVHLTLQDVKITESGGPLSFTGAGNTLALVGANNLSATRAPGIRVESGTELTIDGSGTLTAWSNSDAGIGGGWEGAGGTVTISGGTINATSYDGAGIGGGSDYGGGGTITISGGTVNATSRGGAGIGGGGHGYGGTIMISGGTVTATSRYGAGIGSGFMGIGGTVTIFGGTVNATSETGMGIGGGENGTGGTVTISGGTINATSRYNGNICTPKDASGVVVQLTTVGLDGVSTATAISALAAGTPYGVQDVRTDSNGKLYLYLPAGKTVTEVRAASLVYGGAIGAGGLGTLYVPDFNVTGSAGYTYDYANRTLRFTESGSFRVSMMNPGSTTTTSRIIVNGGVTADITLDSVRIHRTSGNALDMADATVNLALDGSGTLQGGPGCAGLRCPQGAVLTIRDGAEANIGMLSATGVSGGAGIGGNSGEGGGAIAITGGAVFAQSDGGQDIGDGQNGSGGALAILDTAAVFLKNDACPTPVNMTHTHLSISDHVPYDSVYDFFVPWAGNFGAYLRLYTLSYSAGSGQGTVAPITQRYDTTTAVASGDSLSRTGYAFCGWNTQEDGGGMPFMPGSPFAFTADTTLYAQWALVTYQLSCDLTGGEVQQPTPTSYTYESAAITLENPTKTGYIFTGWSGTDIATTSMNVTIQEGSTGDRTYTANWTPEAYSILYLLDGGAVTPANPASYTIESAAIALRRPTKTGYAFAGWSGTGIEMTSMDVTIPKGSTGDRAYAAHWTPTAYTITYHLNGGAVNPANPTGYTIESAAITLRAPTKTGYTFAGWTGTGLDGTTKSVTIQTKSTGNRSYTANWTANAYTVRYDSNGGTGGSTAASSHVYNVSRALTANGFTRTGYTFAGWATSATGPVAYANGQSVRNLTATNGATVTLWAKWTIRNHTVTFMSQGGSAVATKTVAYNNLVPKPTDPTRTGYTFAGWYKQAACITAWNFATDKVTANITLYAKWTPFAAPAAPKATATSYNSVKVTWSAVSGAGGYEVWRSTGTGYTLTATTAATSHTSAGLATGTTYYYKVRAYRTVNGVRNYSAYTAAVSARPVLAAATGLKATVITYNSVKLTWTATAGAGGYEVWRSTKAASGYTLAATVAGTSSTNNSLATGTTYYYKVRAYRTVNGTKVYGAYSSVVSAKPWLTTPTGVKAARASASSIKVSWAAVAGAMRYEVWRATSNGGTYYKLPDTTTPSYTNTGLTTGKTYYYKVRACRVVNGVKVYGRYSAVVYARP